MQMTLAEFDQAMERFSHEIETGRDFSTEEFLAIGRLWNTLSHYTSLQASPAGARFFRLVRDELMPKMVQSLNMTMSRGFSFYSPEHNFRLGGPPAVEYRYIVPELETGGK
jgi:hypothetical protein